MALASAAAANAALNGLAGVGNTNVIPYVSLHTGAGPGTTGANEYAGVTRQACSWNAAGSSAMTNSSALTFTTDGLTAVTHIGTWSLVSGGTYAIGAALTSNVTAVSITVAAGAISLGAS
jgi:hypothetical protein